MSRSGLRRHLASCTERQLVIETSNQKRGKVQNLYHVQVQDAWDGAFWLHLEIKGTALLQDLDDYLRRIWLECCGHLSMFSIGGWSGEELDMSTRVDRLFVPGLVLTHIYDFGTSSETLVEVVSERTAKATTAYPLTLMGRNEAPEITCQVCGAEAAWLCIECMYEDEQPGVLCDAHAADHAHQAYGGPLPIVNSPRVGMCGYEGPANPPY